MVNEIRINEDNIEFEDVALGDIRTLTQLDNAVKLTGNQTKAGILTLSDTPKMDAISEKTADAGVTIDGVLIKDSLDVSGIVNKASAQTITGKKTFSDNIVLGNDKIIQTNVKARAYLGAQQDNLVDGTWTKVLLDTESYDVGSDFANYKFTAPVTGYYLIVGQVVFTNVITDKLYAATIYKNGANTLQGYAHSSLAADTAVKVTDILYLAANDYMELYALSAAGVNTVDIKHDTKITYMSIHLLSV